MAEGLTHFDDQGASRMVDVGGKPVTHRVARAAGRVHVATATADLIRQGAHAKGNVLEVARLAGIMAAKRTGELIPLCHPIGLTAVRIDFEWLANPPSPGHETLRIECQAEVHAPTGVEMEAMTAVSVAALTVYDMCKAVDRGMTIDGIELVEKLGGRSGHWVRTGSSTKLPAPATAPIDAARNDDKEGQA
jgi:cyclic pyranopterin phosphate synthase